MTTSDIVLLIRMEHRNFATLLDILDQELAQLDREGQLDHDLVEALLDYFLSYADQCHHPKEDLVYHKVEAVQAGAGEDLNDLVAEHEELERVTGRLADLVQATRGQAPVPDERLAGALRRFLAFYRSHMAMEETQFLPAAERLLSADDWEAIEFDLFDKADPVFDEQVELRYQGLRDKIFALRGGEGDAAPPSPPGDDDFPGDRMTLERFNDLMAERSQSARLSRAAEGGYRLAAAEGRMVAIPEIGEAEAVRCAIYFLKGQGSLP